jgi:membrane-associated protease RseP (regulator of RpoE activity)
MFLFTLNVAFSFVVAMVLHEMGHWAAARACNIRVLQAGLGWGPKIAAVPILGVDCQLRALPLGAFTRMDMAVLQRRPLAQQLLVLSAGVGINLFLGILTWGTTFGFINLALAVGNLLPVYQLDGWKSGMVICRQIFGGRNPRAEWAFTILGGLFVTALVVQALFI